MTEAVDTNVSSRAELSLTGLAVAGAAALMLATMGRAVGPLVIALGFSYAIWLTNGAWPAGRRIVPVLIAAVIVQCVHFGEELWSGFYRAFPLVMGGGAWSERQFVVFNAVWLAVFVAAIFGVAHGWRPAYVVTLFLAVGGGIGNGLGHLALAIQAGGYFPGLYTAPVVLVVGIMLLIRHHPAAGSVDAAL
jgi:hypothetical protein